MDPKAFQALVPFSAIPILSPFGRFLWWLVRTSSLAIMVGLSSLSVVSTHVFGCYLCLLPIHSFGTHYESQKSTVALIYSRQRHTKLSDPQEFKNEHAFLRCVFRLIKEALDQLSIQVRSRAPFPSHRTMLYGDMHPCVHILYPTPCVGDHSITNFVKADAASPEFLTGSVHLPDRCRHSFTSVTLWPSRTKPFWHRDCPWSHFEIPPGSGYQACMRSFRVQLLLFLDQPLCTAFLIMSVSE